MNDENKGSGPVLERSGRSYSLRHSQQYPKIEPAHMDKNSFGNILMTPQIHPPHPSRFAQMGKRPLDLFSPLPLQLLASLASDPPRSGSEVLAQSSVRTRRGHIALVSDEESRREIFCRGYATGIWITKFSTASTLRQSPGARSVVELYSVMSAGPLITDPGDSDSL